MPHLDHVGIAVQKSDPLVKVLHDLFNVIPYKQEGIDQDHVKTYFIDAGTTKVEIVEPLDASSVLNRFLERRGDSLHHLAFEVDDVDAAMERARRMGYDPLEDEPRPGADGKRIFFLHPRQTAGILIEICQTVRSVLGPESDFSGGTMRTAGSPVNPWLAYLYEGDPTLNQPNLAAYLEPRFHFESVRISVEADDKVEWPARNPGGSIHVVLDGNLVLDIVSRSRRVDVEPSTVTLVNPPEPADPSLIPETIARGKGVLVLAVGDGAAQAALQWHESVPGSRFAALPDQELAPQVIAKHVLKFRGLKGPTE